MNFGLWELIMMLIIIAIPAGIIVLLLSMHRRLKRLEGLVLRMDGENYH